MNELKPCPFCGNDKPMIHARTCDKGDRYDPADRAFPIVRCHTCGCCAEGTDWSEPKTAIEKWNRRTAPEGMAMVIAEYLAMSDGYDPDDRNCGLYDLRWSGGTNPEPVGDAWTMDYLSKAERIVELLDAAKVKP